MDTLFSRVADLVNQRPIAIKSFVEDDIHAITPNDLLLGRAKNSVPGPTYNENDNLTRRQEVMSEIETTWWN